MTDPAATLRALHRPGTPLVLPNVWDAATARVVADAGFPAVATGSAAVAASLGYPDGEAAPADEMFATIGRIARAVAVPVTADVERGYGWPPDELVRQLAATGAVGCNIEDSDPGTGRLVDADEQADFLAAVRAAADRAGIDLVVNARVDTFHHGDGDPARRLAEAVRRGRLYAAAGADCVYPILFADPAAIRTLVAGIPAPVNILYRPGTPSLADLTGTGVARISLGSGVHHAALEHVGRLVTAIHEGRGPYDHAG